jgi:protein O-mannosyl-transferase
MLKQRWHAFLFGLLILSSALVFLPGRSGPLIFDDYSNLVENSYVKIKTLSAENLERAAYSLDAGPLQRPIPMVTFALNYYWTGSFYNTLPYKLTNIAIHALNGLLVFWLMYLILSRAAVTEPRQDSNSRSPRDVMILASAAAVLWVVHPIQASAALYIVQRMTELAATFTLLALVSYLIARRAILRNTRWAPWLLVGGPLLFGTLGMLSKENTALLPVYLAVIEYCFYSSEIPWSHWKGMSLRTKRLIIGGIVLALIVAAIGIVRYALPGYGVRQFDMYERVLTESRVLFFYLALIFVPRLDQFGHQHDDIQISTSFFSPWTTLPSIIGHIAILALAVMVYKRHRLITFGILWFYASHLLESTVLPLEIAHEHRNYLGLLGPICMIIGLVEAARARLEWRRARWILAAAGIAFAATSVARADEWRDYNSFYRYEAIHHPQSPRIQIGLSILLEGQGQNEEAIAAIRRAIKLDPKEVGYLLDLYLSTARIGTLPTQAEQERTIELLKSEPLSASTFLALQHTAACLQTGCQLLQAPLETWARTALQRSGRLAVDKSYYHYLLGLACAAQGKVVEATKYLWMSSEEDRAYLHPLFALARIYVDRRDLDGAERVLAELERVNGRVSHPRDRELAAVRRDVEALQAAALKTSSRASIR